MTKTALPERPLQETTSTYFNNILNRDVTPQTVLTFDPDKIKEFKDVVAQAFPEQADDINHRVYYLIPYILQTINWDEYGSGFQPWQLIYYYQRDRFLQKTGLRYEDFMQHEPLMRSIQDLGLQPEPTFEFILFLKYYYELRSGLRFSSVEQLDKLMEALSSENVVAKMDVVVNGHHFKFENTPFIKSLFGAIDPSYLNSGAFRDNFDEGGAREKIRALDYYLVKTLLDYLPIKSRSQRGQYSQPERNFGLSVLNFCGRIGGDSPEVICSNLNNVTFDKLMRDFKGVRIPFAMELFL